MKAHVSSMEKVMQSPSARPIVDNHSMGGANLLVVADGPGERLIVAYLKTRTCLLSSRSDCPTSYGEAPAQRHCCLDLSLLIKKERGRYHRTTPEGRITSSVASFAHDLETKRALPRY